MPDQTAPDPRLAVTIEAIRAAAKRLDGRVGRTPMRRSRALSELSGAEVWIKYENNQYTAAFKERGALNKLLQLSEQEKKRGVIAASIRSGSIVQVTGS
ncbi:MAG TPA: pyridoxal-phosphate dependent enzyme, partial [Terricaulis sp.]|nr:pyridoxal-phosphate dependent enzyme [Terricaulis sp.]